MWSWFIETMNPYDYILREFFFFFCFNIGMQCFYFYMGFVLNYIVYPNTVHS